MRHTLNLLKEHAEKCTRLQNQLLDWLKTGIDPKEPSSPYRSHMMRPQFIAGQGPKLSMETFNQVIEINIEQRIALVEPKVTMEQLVEATLPYGLVPQVVAEFKGITIGGAVMGTSLESSSHAFGQFNDTCQAYTLLLGDGTILRVSPQEHADLYYGLSGSFGTLGRLLSIEVRLVPTTGWVKLIYRRMESAKEAIEWMGKQHRQSPSPDYIEGLHFAPSHIVAIDAVHCQPGSEEKIALSKSWSPWFYQIMREKTEKLPLSEAKEFVMPIKDYLFRYDRGAFWMGTYALQSRLLAQFCGHLMGMKFSWLTPKNYDEFTVLKDPGQLFRFLCGWMASSSRLYSILHHGGEEWFAKRAIIQDFYIPESHAAEYINQTWEKTGISPLWICPIKTAGSQQFLAPHALQGDLAFDVGVYGFPKESNLTAYLERLSHDFGGRKMLYSYSFFKEEEFWKVYPKESYDALRKKYNAEIFPSITDKVL